jgi:hypothetical protein
MFHKTEEFARCVEECFEWPQHNRPHDMGAWVAPCSVNEAIANCLNKSSRLAIGHWPLAIGSGDGSWTGQNECVSVSVSDSPGHMTHDTTKP